MKRKSEKGIKNLTILGKHWYDGCNYYHVAQVYLNGDFIGSKLDISYSDSAVYATALEVLKENGYFLEFSGQHTSNGFKKDQQTFNQWRMDSRAKIIFDNCEVKRKKDLPLATIGLAKI